MDLSKLVVGQLVNLSHVRGSGWGRVVEVTASGVTVEFKYEPETLLHFDKDGNGLDDEYDGPWSIGGAVVMDLHKLVAGQRVTLSAALPGGGNVGVVEEITKWCIAVAVDAQIEGRGGAYHITFGNDGDLREFYGWYDNVLCREPWSEPCPVFNLKIIGIEESHEN